MVALTEKIAEKLPAKTLDKISAPQPPRYYTRARFIGFPKLPVPLLLAGREEEGRPRALTHISFLEGNRPVYPDADWIENAGFFSEALRQLEAYFAGELKVFDLPLAPQGTPFQMKVWRTLQTIPHGQTWSYGQLARAIGQPSASRAVGAANGRNPLPIVIPCHRVVGSNGDLTGFGGGVEIKAALLEMEQTTTGGLPRQPSLL